LIVSIAVPLLLLIFLLMPRIVGFSLFPVGFPFFGASPVATVYITAQSSEVKGSYILTASSKITQPDLAAQAVPVHQLQSSVSDSSNVATSGTVTVAGQQAQGTVTFSNTNRNAVNLQSIILTTPSGVRFQVATVTVPSRHNGQPGKIDATAIAVDAGVAGNIPAHALDGPCCANGITVSNDQDFADGIDGNVTHTVAQSDLDKVQAHLAPILEQKALQQLQKQLGPDDALAGKPAYKVIVMPSVQVGDQAASVQISVSVSATATSYARSMITNVAQQLLNRQEQQSLGKQYLLSGTPTISTPTVQQTPNGNVYLNIGARGFWFYDIPADEINKWPTSIKGSSTAAALAYLNGQPGVHGVEIHLPFGTDTLPTDITNIKFQIITP